MECGRHNYHFRPFFALLPNYWPRKLKFEKKCKKNLDILSFYTCLEISSFHTSVPKIMIIGYTVPKIWHVTNVIIFHFRQFFALLPPNSKNGNFRKMKKAPRDIIFNISVPKIIIICYNVPGIWCVTHVFFFILGNFLPFYPPNNPKNQNFKRKKKHLEISSFYTSVPKIMIRWCMVPEI